MRDDDTLDNLIPDEAELIDIANNTEFETTESGHSTETDKKTDFELVRNAMREVLVSTQDSIKQAIQLANSADDAKGYSALASLINSFTNISDKLIDLHKDEKPKETGTNDRTPGTITNVDKQIVFQGSTTEILRLIKKSDNDGPI